MNVNKKIPPPPPNFFKVFGKQSEQRSTAIASDERQQMPVIYLSRERNQGQGAAAPVGISG